MFCLFGGRGRFSELSSVPRADDAKWRLGVASWLQLRRLLLAIVYAYLVDQPDTQQIVFSVLLVLFLLASLTARLHRSRLDYAFECLASLLLVCLYKPYGSGAMGVQSLVAALLCVAALFLLSGPARALRSGCGLDKSMRGEAADDVALEGHRNGGGRDGSGAEGGLLDGRFALMSSLQS